MRGRVRRDGMGVEPAQPKVTILLTVLRRLCSQPSGLTRALTSVADDICLEVVCSKAFSVVHHARTTTDISEDEDGDGPQSRMWPRAEIDSP